MTPIAGTIDSSKLNMVKSNLVFYIDFASKSSYPGSGNIVYDLSGNNRNGTLINSPTFSTSNGGILTFNGSNNYIQFGNFLDNTPNITVGAWINTSDQTSKRRTIIGKCANYGSGAGWELGVNTNAKNGVFHFMSQESGGNRWAQSDTGAPTPQTFTSIVDGTWRYIVATLGAINVAPTLYNNGVLANPQTVVSSGDTAFTSISTTTNVYIGAREGGVEPLNGQIGMVHIYNRVLTGDEILQNYKSIKGRYGL